jgi:hypothetical protein
MSAVSVAGLAWTHDRSLIALPPIGAHGNRTMGDKSPKAMRKQAEQKQTKTNEDSRQKQAAVTAKQVATKKK